VFLQIDGAELTSPHKKHSRKYTTEERAIGPARKLEYKVRRKAIEHKWQQADGTRREAFLGPIWLGLDASFHHRGLEEETGQSFL
jgi:anaerobic glycerol-3-phosphate dehydrogenase